MKECIFCWSQENITREHIIPKSIFTWWNFRTDLIVLPSCKKCNWEYAEIEQIFVHQIHMIRWIEKEEIKAKLVRRFNNPKLKNSNLTIKKSFKTKKLNWVERLYCDIDKEISNEIIFKICKWLNYLHYGKKLSWDDYEIVIHREKSSDLSEAQIIQKKMLIDKFDFSTLEKWKVYTGYFRYDYKEFKDWMTIFKLTFYEDIDFFALFFRF
jgi:hypothetical protein